MGLIKEIADPEGQNPIPAAYSKIARLVIDDDMQTVELTLAVYRTQEARTDVDANGRPLYRPVRRDTFVITNTPSAPGEPTYSQYKAGDQADPAGTMATAYGFLKTFTSWAGAADA